MNLRLKARHNIFYEISDNNELLLFWEICCKMKCMVDNA